MGASSPEVPACWGAYPCSCTHYSGPAFIVHHHRDCDDDLGPDQLNQMKIGTQDLKDGPLVSLNSCKHRKYDFKMMSNLNVCKLQPKWSSFSISDVKNMDRDWQKGKKGIFGLHMFKHTNCFNWEQWSGNFGQLWNFGTPYQIWTEKPSTNEYGWKSTKKDTQNKRDHKVEISMDLRLQIHL